MATIDLAAQPRTVLGKYVKKMRREGIIPANIYGQHLASVPIQAPALELRKVLRAAGHTGLVRITIDGAGPGITTVIRGVRKESMTGKLVHVDFQSVSMTEKMTVRVPIVLTGVAPVAELNGQIFQALEGVDVECLPGDIPQHFEVDVSGMDASDSQIHVRDLALAGNVTLLTDGDVVIAAVRMPSVEEPEEGEEAAETGAAPAATEEAGAAE
jgi:large subunit ribosomal protein L25